MKKSHKSKKQTLFDPDKVATAIHQAITRDFKGAQHVYCLNDRTTLYAFNRQVNEFRKKYVSPDLSQETLEDLTYEKFHKVNAHMAEVNERLKLCLPSDQSRIQSSTPYMEKIHRRARALVHSVLRPFSVEEWFTECKNSVGSSIGVSYSDTSNEAKFTFPMSTTKRAKPYMDAYMLFDGNMNRAVKAFNRDNPVKDMYEYIEGSRATTVEKNETIRRFIAIEGSCNMFLQQGLMSMMYEDMKKFHLDVEFLPEQHKQKAKVASVSLHNATIDWSSASDCGSRVLYRWLLPPKWFSAVDKTRSTCTFIKGEKVDLNMFSTMGNAVTFPLETLVFWAYANATILSQTKTNALFPNWEDLKQVSVFGDDCIVPSSIASEFIRVMTTVGFIINDDKSYYGTEQFRESCGGDYLQGVDVRPYCLKAPRSTKLSSLEPWLYIIANSLITRYISYFGVTSYLYDKELFRTLAELFGRYKFQVKLVPSYFPDDSGLKMSFDIERFQRHYGLKLSPIARSCHGTYSFNFLRFVYWQREKKDEGIQLCLWLKKPRQSVRPPLHDRYLRKRGGYVVAKGASCHWHVPAIKSVPS